MRNLVLVFALAFALPSHAAEITMNHGSDGLDIVSINGTFNAGDEAVFKKIAAESNRAVVVLNSGGGNLVTELEIGRAIRFRGFATAVPEGALCASACALTWLAGTPRLLDDGSKLGFHAAYRVIDGHASEYGAANALVGAYLIQLGLSDRAVVYITSAPPEGMAWLTSNTASQVGIGYEALAAQVPQASKPTAAMAHDPICRERFALDFAIDYDA